MSEVTFRDKNVLITGGSSGIGYELAKLFLKEKARVILVANNSEKLKHAARVLEKEFSAEVLSIAKDLSNPSSPKAIFEFLSSQKISIDVLVNNAGFGIHGNFHETDLEKTLKMIDVNARSVVMLTHLFLPGMIAKKNAWLMNVASTAGFQAIPNVACYAASKVFVVFFSEAIADELKGTGVQVTCFCPGATDTPFFSHAEYKASKYMHSRMMKSSKVASIGLKALKKNRRLVIAGLRNQIPQLAARFAPRRVVSKIAKRMVQ